MKPWVILFLSTLSCASHITPAVLPARVAPPGAPLPGVRACWVEFSETFGFTASGILVHHPKGVLLIDAGQSTAFASEIGDHPFREWWYLKAVPGGLIPDAPAADVIRRAGVEPGTLWGFIPTHAHSDHLGGLMDLPDIPILMSPAEIDVVTKAPTEAHFNVIPAHSHRLVGRMRPLDFVAAPYEVFSQHADVFGDGSVVVVPLPGHTPGSVGVFINLPGQRLFNAGDAINTVDAMEDLRGKQFYLQRTDENPAQADARVAELAALHAQVPLLHVLPAHQRTAWAETFGTPGACVE